MKVRYFQTDAGYLAITDQSPRDFPKVLFVGKSGTDPSNVKEGVFSERDVRGLKEIALAGMPAEWIVAFGYEQPPEAKVEEFPLFDPEEPHDLWAYIPVRRPPVVTAPPQSEVAWIVGMIIGGIVLTLCYVTGIF